MNGPLVSVVIPAYNSGNFIQNSLASVIQQSYKNFEIIVSDDGSTDKTTAIVESVLLLNKGIKTKLLKNQHQGPGFARNQGILNSSGSWIAFLDSDDLWYKYKLSRVAEYIQRNPEIELWCHSELVKSKNSQVACEHYKRFDCRATPFLSMYRNNSLSTSAVTVKKDALFRAGLFDEELPNAQDYDLWIRLADTAKIGFIKDVLGVYVSRDDSITSYNKRRLRCLLRIAEKYRAALKQKTRFYFIEEAKFKGRAYIDAGLGLISKGRKAQGLILLCRGIIRWPFRKFNIKNNVKKIIQ